MSLFVLNQTIHDMKGLMARSAVEIKASKEDVWDALTNPQRIKEYMFGTEVSSEWRKGSPITWKGEWNGKPYEDKGTIMQFEPHSILEYTHFSPLTGKPDTEENYHTVVIRLQKVAEGTNVTLVQDNNDSPQAVKHSEKNWQTMLESMKKMLEHEPVAAS